MKSRSTSTWFSDLPALSHPVRRSIERRQRTRHRGQHGRLKANVVSNSYGGGEYAKSDPAFVHPGVAITASAGDGDYYDFPSGGWGAYGGTSVSSPLIAGVFALARNSAATAQPAGIWSHKGAYLNDVTTGNNLVPSSVNRRAVVCPPAWEYICYAGAGYDGPIGWGTPSGVGAF